ncbi:hypothetical protein Clacol_005573 [Clathrus columnatus]|uniref:Uncharacterized protein n=1 Tax=Clathrus columnatus TaxID=1419009 RepID=A0AAV5A9Q1_9AGAM|nr:hypothetical protein Clacol_005573 [Clathrus columnatus]
MVEFIELNFSIAVDDENFQQNVDPHNFKETQGLLPVKKLSDLFPQPPNPEHVHIVVRQPQPVSAIPPDHLPSINPLKRKYENAGGDYLLDEKSALNQLLRALWGRGSDGFIREISSELVPDLYETSTEVTETTAVSGIGKTTYLTYHLVQRLLAGQATIFSLNPHDRYLFHQSGVYDISGHSLRSLRKTNPELIDAWSLVLVDFNTAQTQSDLAIFQSNPILAASSPNRARYKYWLKESGAVTYVMKTWKWNEAFQARKLIPSKYNYETDELRDCFLKYGGCARHLLKETPAVMDSQIATAIKMCPDIRKLVGIQDSIPEDESSMLIRVEPYVDSDSSINRNFMYCKVISQHVFSQIMQEHRSVVADAFREISNLF